MTELISTLPQKKFKILLLGDVCLDTYVHGNVEKLSPEAPVPIFVPKNTWERNGMAHNVYENLIALGASVIFRHGNFSKKTRYIEEKSRYQLFRIDEDVISEEYDFNINDIFDAIVISDYNKGFISYDTVSQLKKLYTCPIFIDSKKKDLAKFEGCFLKINELEYNTATSHSSNMIITLGSNGSMYKEKIYPTSNVEVHDVTGAGDVFLATLCMFYLLTSSIEKSIPYANKLSSTSVQHEGSYVIQQTDLEKL
jgi:D-beta-D-heptose 7-phosphate kinase/D-beta-D-heptose 1-phosphate adenosyltransferase